MQIALGNALPFFRLFYQCSCRTVYVDGSFASTKKYPEDIDLCFDLTDVQIENIEKVFPAFFDPNELGRIHRDLQCHLLYVTRKYSILFDMLKNDRDGNPKGFVKLSLKQTLQYDQERKTI